MQHVRPRNLLKGTPVIALSLIFCPMSFANSITDAITNGKSYGDFRLRYESVEQKSTKKDANALTLRSRLGYKTGSVQGFSGLIEFEDSRNIMGVNDYNDALGTTSSKTEYAIIADGETTELDQAYLQYNHKDTVIKLGRQVITHENHRFIGHVGWRQDRQTFNGVALKTTPLKDLAIEYDYINKRNRIFAEEKDINSNDHMLNIAYKTHLGKIIGYSYLLEEDNQDKLSLDTYGLRFSGSKKSNNLTFHYTGEYATQEKAKKNTNDSDADYYFLEGGISTNQLSAKLGYEALGTDQGTAGSGFSTPLATLHKFNGWSDQFLNTPDQGLVDIYASISARYLKGNWTIAYHDFSADKSTSTTDDLGSELNISYITKFSKNYSAGIKYAVYNAEDAATVNGNAKTYIDTDKVWVWLGAKF